MVGKSIVLAAVAVKSFLLPSRTFLVLPSPDQTLQVLVTRAEVLRHGSRVERPEMSAVATPEVCHLLYARGLEGDMPELKLGLPLAGTRQTWVRRRTSGSTRTSDEPFLTTWSSFKWAALARQRHSDRERERETQTHTHTHIYIYIDR